MKKLLAIVLGVVLLAAAGYAASAYYIGKQVEVSMAEPYKKLAYDPNVKVIKRDYQRGVFASTETVVIEVFGDIFRALGQAPLTLTAHSIIKHGPAPGMTAMAAAIVDSELLLGAGGAVGQKLMTVNTVIRHDGTGDMKASGVASAFEFPDPLTGAAHRVSWEAFDGAMQFSEAMKQYAMQARMPRFEVSGGDGMRIAASGIRMDIDAKQVFVDEPSLYASTQKVTVDEISAKARFGAGAAVVLRKLAYSVTTPVRGELLDGVMKSTVAEVLIDKQNYGPASFDMSVKNMHGRTIARLQKAMAGLNTADKAPADPMAAIQPMLDAGVELLTHGPELVIDRFSFTTPQGEVLVRANAKLVGVTRDDASNMMALVQKVDATMDVALPEAMLMTQFGPAPVSQDAADSQIQMRRQQVSRLVEQGYAVREGATMKTRLAYQGGQVTVNGLPFDPAAMMQPPHPVQQPIPMPTARPRAPMPVAR